MDLTRVAVARGRWAVTAVFSINGLLIASLAVRTPSLRLNLGLTAGQLGLGSAVFGVSAVAAMQGASSVPPEAQHYAVLAVARCILGMATALPILFGVIGRLGGTPGGGVDSGAAVALAGSPR